MKNLTSMYRVFRYTKYPQYWPAEATVYVDIAPGTVEEYVTDLNGVPKLIGNYVGIVTYANYASFPTTGKVNRMYIDGTTNYLYRWDGSAYVGINSATPSAINKGTTSGTDTYTVNISTVTSYSTNDLYVIKFANANTGAATLNISGLGAKTLVKNNNVGLVGGDIQAGQEFAVIYDGTNMQVIGIAPNQMFAFVTNAESTQITKGQVVYAYGATGDRMTVKLASNLGDPTSAKTIGLVFSSTIAANGTGYIITQGVIQNLNLGSYTAGDTLYLDSTAGGFTKVKPHAPNHLVYIGIVERANAGNGQIYVRPQNGYELDEIHDVDLYSTAPVNNDILTYITGTNNLWKPRSIASILGFTPYSDANPAGYITSSALSPYLTSATAASTYQPIGTYATASNSMTFTNKSGNISQWTNDSGYLTSITSLQITTALGYTPQAQLNGGTGFVYSTAGTITYITDNLARITGNTVGSAMSLGSVNNKKVNLIANNFSLFELDGAGGSGGTNSIKVGSTNTTITGGITDFLLGNTTFLSLNHSSESITLAGKGFLNIETVTGSGGDININSDAGLFITSVGSTQLFADSFLIGGATTTTIYGTTGGILLQSQTTLQNSLIFEDNIGVGGSLEFVTPAFSTPTVFSYTLPEFVPTDGQLLSSNNFGQMSWVNNYIISTGLTNTSGTVTNNLSTGYSGGQSIYGGTAASENLTLSSTFNVSKNKIFFGTSGVSAFDEGNDRLGIGTASPTSKVTITNGSNAQVALAVSTTNNVNNALSVSATNTDTSGTQPCTTILMTLNPATSSSSNTRALYMTNQLNSTASAAFTGNPVGGFFETRYFQAGTITRVSGGQFAGIFIPSNVTAASITLSNVEGLQTQGITISASAGFTGTVTNVRGIYITQPNKGLSAVTFTNSVGLVCEALTNATNNTYLLLGTTTSPSGNWGIYVSSTNNSYFAGNVGLNVTPSSYRLDVNGTGRFSSSLTTTGRIQATVTKTGAYTLVSTDRVVFASAASPYTLTLPSAVNGQEYTIVKTDNNANLITIAATGVAKINGVSTYVNLNALNKHVTVVSNGTDWFVTSSN
jgi:hypothetical protein